MTSLDYGLDMPYEVQLEHNSAISNNHMVILAAQRSPGQPAFQHLLTPGVYMVSLAYNGSQAATLEHVGGGTTNTVSVLAGAAGTPRTSAPIKISVQGTNEYLRVASRSEGGSARATISVLPAPTFDEMAESAQGVSVLSEIDTLKTNLDARVPAETSLRLDTSVGTRVFAGDTMIYGELPWRDISPLLGAGWSGTIQARRDNNIATIRLEGVTAEANASKNMITLPFGVRPNVSSIGGRWIAHMATYPATLWRGQLSVAGTMSVISPPPPADKLYGDISFPTPAAWPSTWA